MGIAAGFGNFMRISSAAVSERECLRFAKGRASFSKRKGIVFEKEGRRFGEGWAVGKKKERLRGMGSALLIYNNVYGRRGCFALKGKNFALGNGCLCQ